MNPNSKHSRHTPAPRDRQAALSNIAFWRDYLAGHDPEYYEKFLSRLYPGADTEEKRKQLAEKGVANAEKELTNTARRAA